MGLRRAGPRATLQMANVSPLTMGTHRLALLCSQMAESVNLHHPKVSLRMELSPSKHHLQTVLLLPVPLTAWEAALFGRKAHAR